MLSKLLFFSSLQWLPTAAQVYFNQPTAGEIINGGVPFIVSCTDSYTAPYFSQMTNFSLLLLAGTYSSPVTLYAWNLSNTSPSTVSNSVTFPPSIGPSAASAYFLGIKGSILANTSISITYFSPQFTLHNMTGDTSLIPYIPVTTPTITSLVVGGTTIPVTETASPGRMIMCSSSDGSVQEIGETGGNGPVLDRNCEVEALNYLEVLVTQVRTVTAFQAPIVTTPPAFAAFSTLLAAFTPSSSESSSSPSATASGQSPTSTSSNTNIAATNTTNAQNPKMVEMLIFGGITLATVIILFFIWMKYGRRRYAHGGCEHRGCDCSGMTKMWDNVSRPILYGKVKLDTEKGGLVTVWRKERESEESQGSRELDSSGVRRELESSEGNSELSARATETEAAAERPRRSIAPERRATSTSDRRSRRTILAELEGDTGVDTPELPTPDFKRQMIDPIPVPQIDKRAVVVGKCEQGMVVRGREAAVIVAVSKRKRSDSGATATIQQSGDLLHIPPKEAPDACEEFLRTKRQEQVGVLADATRIRMIRKESYVLRKSEENEEREKREVTEGESCASPVVSPCEHFVSISS
ncbi:hypothetical protein L207DRAFT_587822 [Hyaloscypha variabilis F]|uniref:Uncharacterized protein n=1 Tax=Hyaloscypha variabilis (strain UAMH 11265 / GT02V1 / F) TaxID=1149755 RepID=A0A2J6RAJ3_HYAVF|nr:hypothetical protein L207DRAFT_587822 [Hyaloscypha variabilis F]